MAFPIVKGQVPAQPLLQQMVHLGGGQVGQLAVGSQGKAPQGLKGRDVRLIRAAVGKDPGQGAVDGGETFLMAEQAGRPRLRYQDAAGVQPRLGKAIVFLGIEQVSRAALHRIHQVHYHHIEPLVGSRQVGAGILMQQGQTGVVKTALMMLRQMLAAQLHYGGVQVQHNHPRHGGMGQDFAQGAALAAAADENPGRMGVDQHCRLHQGLVVDMLVPLGGLGFAVQHQAAAVEVGFHHLDVLVVGPTGKKHPLHPQHHRQVGIDRLQQPLAGYFVHSPYRPPVPVATAAGRKIRPRSTSWISGARDSNSSTSAAAACRG